MVWEIAHAVRGRMRVRYTPGWLHARRTTIEARLRQVPGVRTVDARPLTGSLSIDYDPRRVTHASLVAALTEIAGEPALEGNGTGALIEGGGAATPWSVMLQLAGATSALAATAMPVGAPVKAALVLGAALPSLVRAGRALAGVGRLNGDVLEALTLVLLAARGQQAAAGLLLWFRAAGDFVLSRSTGRARRSLRELVAPETQTAWRLDGDERSAVAVRSLKPGDLIVVTGPQPLVVDGTVVRGEAYVDQQTMTGEGLPVERREGDPVFAATVVEDGEIVVRVDRTGEDTAIGRIIRELDAATEQKSDIQDFAERLADSQASRTLVLAALGAAFSGSLSAGIAILVADYGMAARVGIPTALVSAMTTASRAGILIKGTRVLENLARVNTLVFDKTGTLTSGTPAVSRLVTYDRARDGDELVRLTAAAERGYRHPVARAIAALAEERGLHVPRRRPGVPAGGLGVDARVEDARVLVGSRRFMASHDIDLTAAVADEAAAHTVGGSPTFVAVDGRLAGLIVLRDELRADAPALVAALRARGMRDIVMVTGDHPEPTRVIAGSLGVREFYPDMMPADKAALVRRLKRRGRVVAMVGDGVNDALALDVADVGIAVRGGPAVVAEAADIVLVRAGLDGVVQAIDIARAGLGAVRRTVRVAARANLAVVGLASVGVARPVASILLSRGVAVAAATRVGAPGPSPPPRPAPSVSTR